MGKSCCCVGCKEKFVKGGSVTFHRFPKDHVKRVLWAWNLGRDPDEVSDSILVCSTHFTADCFDLNKLGGTWLKADAVPTIFNSPSDLDTKILKVQQLKNKQTVQIQAQYADDDTDLSDTLVDDKIDERTELSSENCAKACSEELKDKCKSLNYCPASGPSPGVQTTTNPPCHHYENDPPLFKRLKYIGDFTEADMVDPKKAKALLSIALAESNRKARQIKSLKQNIRRLQQRVKVFEELNTELKMKSCATKSMKTTKKVKSKEEIIDD